MATKRERAGAKKLDMGTIRQALMDGRVWTGLGVVRLFDGETAYYEIDTSSGTADVMIDVELAPNGERLVCRLGAAGGVVRIPPVGAEVAVVIPEGDFDSDAIIVAELTSPTVGVPGLAPGVTVIMNTTAVLIHDGDENNAVPLAKKSDVDEIRAFLRKQFDPATGVGHVHGVSGALTTTIATGNGAGTTPAAPLDVPAMVGTSLLKGQ